MIGIGRTTVGAVVVAVAIAGCGGQLTPSESRSAEASIQPAIQQATTEPATAAPASPVAAPAEPMSTSTATSPRPPATLKASASTTPSPGPDPAASDLGEIDRLIGGIDSSLSDYDWAVQTGE